MDLMFGILFTLFGMGAFLFFAVYWKPILIFFVIMLTVWEPRIGIPIAFVGSFLVILWLERKDFSAKLLLSALKFSFYITVGAIVIGFIVDAMFSGGSGYSGCSRGNPAGC
ncbi:hypothetical protein [Vibrio penaeicida]|uniref:hypothetical protein n=1 Tax=Vibrio penaeicida TaxID=104609 RepID=UPI000CEA63F2|nr:hypothetical protein [Vibrio penaeicida]